MPDSCRLQFSCISRSVPPMVPYFVYTVSKMRLDLPLAHKKVASRSGIFILCMGCDAGAVSTIPGATVSSSTATPEAGLIAMASRFALSPTSSPRNGDGYASVPCIAPYCEFKYGLQHGPLIHMYPNQDVSPQPRHSDSTSKFDCWLYGSNVSPRTPTLTDARSDQRMSPANRRRESPFEFAHVQRR
jgi:hypothetical protein